MHNTNIGKSGKMHMSIIDNHLIELYESAVLEERARIMNELRLLVQEKDVRSDHDAVSVLTWAIDRLNKQN
jgi:hypothetical protein